MDICQPKLLYIEDISREWASVKHVGKKRNRCTLHCWNVNQHLLSGDSSRICAKPVFMCYIILPRQKTMHNSMWYVVTMACTQYRTHGKPPIGAHKASTWALDTAEQLLSRRTTTKNIPEDKLTGSHQWPGHSTSMLMLAFFRIHSGSTRVVIRDELGAVRAASARWLQSTSTALLTEAQACRHGLQVAQVVGLHNVVTEMNYKVSHRPMAIKSIN